VFAPCGLPDRYCGQPALSFCGGRNLVALTSSSACSAGNPGQGGEQIAWAPTSAAFVYGRLVNPLHFRARARVGKGPWPISPSRWRRLLVANAVALGTFSSRCWRLHWSGYLAGRPTLIAMAGIAW